MSERRRNLTWELAQKFSDHYYGSTRGSRKNVKQAPVVALRGNIDKRLREHGIDNFKEWVYSKYSEHLGYVQGVRVAGEFLESVKTLLAEIVLTTEVS